MFDVVIELLVKAEIRVWNGLYVTTGGERRTLNDIPNIFGRVTEFGTCHAGAETVVADTDGLILERICEIVFALGHGTHKHADTLLGA